MSGLLFPKSTNRKSKLRKPLKRSRGPPATKAEKDWMARVAELPCLICGAQPVTIHHCGTFMGGGRSHFKVLPLCWEHHLGPDGIDGKQMGKRVWEAKFGTERALLQNVCNLLNSAADKS